MIVVEDFNNIDESKLKERLGQLVKLKNSEGLDLSFYELVTTPVYLNLNQIGDITSLALQYMMRAKANDDERGIEFACRIYDSVTSYESKLADLCDRVEGIE
jgi:hypothetical protein